MIYFYESCDIEKNYERKFCDIKFVFQKSFEHQRNFIKM